MIFLTWNGFNWKGKSAKRHRPSVGKASAAAYVPSSQTARAASPLPLPLPHPEDENNCSPPCCEQVNGADPPLQSLASDRAPGPRSSSQSTSHCTSVSSKVQGFHVPMSVVLTWSRAEHQFTSAHDAARSRGPLKHTHTQTKPANKYNKDHQLTEVSLIFRRSVVLRTGHCVFRLRHYTRIKRKQKLFRENYLYTYVWIVGENIEHFNEVLIYWAVSSLIAPFVSLAVTSDYKTETSMFLQWKTNMPPQLMSTREI